MGSGAREARIKKVKVGKISIIPTRASLVAQTLKNLPINAGDLGSIPGLGRSPGEGNGYPLQYSGLENPIVFIVHGVAKTQT